MSTFYLSELKAILDNCITELNAIHCLFVKNPMVDFTRNRKILFKDIFNILIDFESKSLPNEMMEYFNHSGDSPTTSAFIQQRAKVCQEAWEFLLRSFNEETSHFQQKDFKGYRLIACDDSDINIARNPDDKETYIKQEERGFNQIHLNATYDLLNRTYLDLDIQGENKLHDHALLYRF